MTDLDAAEPTVTDLLDEIHGALLRRITDPVQRWHITTELRDQLPAVLRHAQALSAAQYMLDGDRSVEDYAGQVGVTRQHVTQLLTEADQPTPRQLRQVGPSAAVRWGIYLGVTRDVADAYDYARSGSPARDEHGKIFVNACSNPSMHRRVQEATTRWLRRLPVNIRTSLRERLEAAEADLDLAGMPRHLPTKQQAEVILGYHSGRRSTATSTPPPGRGRGSG